MTFEDMFKRSQETAVYKFGQHATMQQIMMEMFRIVSDRLAAIENGEEADDGALPDMRCGDG